MRNVSANFLAATRGSAKAAFELDNNLISPGVPAQTLDIIDGTITLDGSADVRATLDVVVHYPWGDVPDPDNVGRFDEVTVYGDFLQPYVGLEFGNGDIELMGMGKFRINTIEQDDVYADSLRITAQDSSCRFTEYRGQFVNTLDSTETVDFVIGLIGSVYDDFSYEADEDFTAVTTGRTIIFGGPDVTAWSLLKDIATSRGKILYFDHNDVLQFVDPPDPRVPVYTIDTGQGGVLIGAARSQTREGVYNVVVAYGESPTGATPPQGFARDENPSSPTYYLGAFGQVQRWYASPLLLTNAQCTKAATSILQRSLGLPGQITLTTLPAPFLEPHDPVLVKFAEGEQEMHIIDTVEIPLVPERPTVLTTRQVPFDPEAPS